jgi:hypothetical protein
VLKPFVDEEVNFFLIHERHVVHMTVRLTAENGVGRKAFIAETSRVRRMVRAVRLHFKLKLLRRNAIVALACRLVNTLALLFPLVQILIE